MTRTPALLVLAVLVVGCARPGDPSPTNGPSQSPAESVSAPASVAPSAHPPSSAPSQAAEEGTRLETDGDVARLVTPWRDGFAALSDEHIWTSTDGVSWEVAETTGIDGAIVAVVERADGGLLAFGYLDTRDPDAFRTWGSDDGVSWQRVEALPTEFVFLDVAYGDRGYVLAGREIVDGGGPNPEQLWYSADARTWEMVRDTRTDKVIAAVGAGPDGFVVVGQQGFQSGPVRGLAVASSDGRNWIEAPADDLALAGVGSLWTIAAHGGDWLTAPLMTGDELPVLWSANGLDWEIRSTVQVEPSDSGVGAELFSIGRRIYMAINDGAGRPVTSEGLLMSDDAVAWSPSGIPSAELPIPHAMNGATALFLIDGIAHVGSED